MRPIFSSSAAGTHPAAIFILCLLSTLVGCKSASVREAMRIDGQDGVYASGHAVSARYFAGKLHYRMQSVLAGQPLQSICRHSEIDFPDGRSVFGVSNCLPAGTDGPDAASVLPAFDRAKAELSYYFPDAAATRIDLVALPFGTRHYSSKRGWRSPDDLALTFALWWGEDGDASLRKAIRTFAHEFIHLAAKVERRTLSREAGEVLASRFESCIEFAVFGSLSYDADDIGDELLMARIETASLRRSVSGSIAARAEADDWLRIDDLGDMRHRCRQLLLAAG